VKRNTFNFWLDLASLVVFFWLVVTGLLVYCILPPCDSCTGGSAPEKVPTLWGLGRHDYGRVHFYLGLTAVTLVVLHLCLHWTWVCCTFGRLAGLNTTGVEHCRLYGAVLLVLVVALVIALLCVARIQVR
jgi:hypothetical protein